ncbi:cellulose binding domain-containing protein [Streptomyces sp. NPDC059582]|uniref:cellulose binding domain-containing protein n=1 Tax=Streptomyces sp. NPDC059582 TaxID=3346875 RepID=UPI0036A3CD07
MSTGRRTPRRRVWPKVRLLLLVAAVVAGGTALYPLWRTAHPAPSDLVVRYRTDTAGAVQAAKPSLEVFNQTKKPIALSDITLRYYFTADGNAPYTFNCVQAAVGCSHIAGSVLALDDPTPTADHYLEISFTSGAGSLSPGANSRGIDLQLYRVDHKPLDQSDDRSFDAGMTSYKEAKKITAYHRGLLAWGEEPTGDKGSPSASPKAATAPTVPPGVLFDNFGYLGPKDPALFNHGWLVRTSKGGPGIEDTWSADGVSFQHDPKALGDGQVLRLRASTDGTKAGTQQASLGTSSQAFRSGTYAARVHFTDAPTSGAKGDHINETFYTIGGTGSTYSELDNEYMPNGGWGRPGPKLDNVTWRRIDDRVYNTTHRSLATGWHTVVVTVKDDVVTYRLDGEKIYTTSGKYAPRAGMSVNFSTWFIDLPFKGERTWDMTVDWFYYHANTSQSVTEVEAAVKGFSSNGLNYFDASKESP